LDDVTLYLVSQPVRVDDLSAIMRNIKTFDRDFASLSRDLHLGDRADISAHQLIFDVGEAISGRDVRMAIRLRTVAPLANIG
jgi:hypothetical protein